MGGRGAGSSMGGFPGSVVQQTVYHTTNAPNITRFRTDGPQSNGAIFFASDEGEAEIHGFNKSGADHYTYEVKLNITNPLRVSNMMNWGDPKFERTQIQKAKRSGHDAVIFDNGFSGSLRSEFYAVFSPDQVKIKGRRKI